MKNSQKVLEVSDLTKVYLGDGYNVKALNNVSFNLFSGEILAIMGTSGSGKSTLLNILGAIDKPDRGQIKIKGINSNDIFQEPMASNYRRKNIGFVFQAFNLLKDLSVEENIALPLILTNKDNQYIDTRVKEIIDLVGLSNWKKHRPTQLSGGQQQRVAIGRAIITYPPIILADEPTGNLDFNTSTEILKILVNMKNIFNQSIVLVTHDPYVATFADRVLFFHDGEIVDEYISRKGDDIMGSILVKFKKITERQY